VFVSKTSHHKHIVDYPILFTYLLIYIITYVRKQLTKYIFLLTSKSNYTFSKLQLIWYIEGFDPFPFNQVLEYFRDFNEKFLPSFSGWRNIEMSSITRLSEISLIKTEVTSANCQNTIHKYYDTFIIADVSITSSA